MKHLRTKEQIRKEYINILMIRKNDLNCLLKHKFPNYYSVDDNSKWDNDYYVVNDNTIICIGKSKMGKFVSKELCKEYNEFAKRIYKRLDYKEYITINNIEYILEGSLEDFVNEAIQNIKEL